MAAILLILLSPALLVLSLTIACQRDGQIFFSQSRAGQHKSPFSILKFRTMTNHKINRVGRWLRPLGLDELPQLWNILCGQMSFVGPRPLTTADIERLGWDSPEYNSRWQVKPGIVGLAQFSPICDQDVSWQLDQRYVQNRSLRLDGKLLIWAALVPFCSKKRVAKWMNLPI